MPIYEYRCSQCQTKFEALRSIKDSDSPIACQKCNSKETHRVVSVCFAKSEGRSITHSSGGCGTCSGSSCSSCGH